MGLATVEMILAIEEAFGVEIADQAIEGLKTPRDVVKHIVSLPHQLTVSRSEVERLVLSIIASQLELPAERVTLDSSLAELSGD